MKNILLHGLGQNSESWDKVQKFLKEKGIETICPNLFEINKNSSKNYKSLCQDFSDFCNSEKEKLNLCGLSLGGVLALDFAKKFPEKINSLILIGVPYKIPKILFKFQNFVFHFMPKSQFEKLGFSKSDFINFVNSMNNLEISKNLEKIKCKTLILCGQKDKINLKSAKLLHKNIKNSKLKIIANSSHEVNIDNPQELAKIIGEFFGK